jgi:hypothetical protein
MEATVGWACRQILGEWKDAWDAEKEMGVYCHAVCVTIDGIWIGENK